MKTEQDEPQQDPAWLARAVAAGGLMAVVAASAVLLALGFDHRIGALSFVAPVVLCYVAVDPLCKLRKKAAGWAALPAESEVADTWEREARERPIDVLQHALLVRVEGAERCRAALDAGSKLLVALRELLDATDDAAGGPSHDARVLAEMRALAKAQRRILREEVSAIDAERRECEAAGLQWAFVETSREAWDALHGITALRATHAAAVAAAKDVVNRELCRELAEGDLSSQGAAPASWSVYGETWSGRMAALKTEWADDA